MFDAAAVADHVAAVLARIEAAGGRDVELIAVTKAFPAEAIRAAMAAGCRAIGENYAQELLAKIEALTAAGCAEADRPEVHFIGHVQTNKVRMLAPVVSVWETVDRPAIVHEIAKRAPGARIFVQVNVTGVRVEGLMTIGVLGDPDAARAGFRTLRTLATSLGLHGCSMGMSDDLEIAVEEGATHVRVGSALFGPRVRDGHGDLR